MLVINLYGGPSAGKSTVAAGLMAVLKDMGVLTELVGEAAKWEVWEGRGAGLAISQLRLFGTQVFRLLALEAAGVEVAVCDSPLLLNRIYGAAEPQCFHDLVTHYHRRWASLEVMLHRVKPYDPRGRMQTREEAEQLDVDIEELVREMSGMPAYVDGNLSGAMQLLEFLRNLGLKGCAPRDSEDSPAPV